MPRPRAPTHSLLSPQDLAWISCSVSSCDAVREWETAVAPQPNLLKWSLPGKQVVSGAVSAPATSAGFWTAPEECGDIGLFPLLAPNLFAKSL